MQTSGTVFLPMFRLLRDSLICLKGYPYGYIAASVTKRFFQDYRPQLVKKRQQLILYCLELGAIF